MSFLQDLADWVNRNVVNYGERTCIEKHLGKLQDSKTYKEVINFLDEKGYSFVDMKTVITVVCFVYNKTPEQVRKDIWNNRERPW